MPNTSPHFLTLPVEIRSRICTFTFQGALVPLRLPCVDEAESKDLPRKVIPDSCEYLAEQLSLLLCCRQLHDECKAMVLPHIVGRVETYSDVTDYLLDYDPSVKTKGSIAATHRLRSVIDNTWSLWDYMDTSVISKLVHIAFDTKQFEELFPSNFASGDLSSQSSCQAYAV